MLVSVFPFVSGGGAGGRSQSDVASHGRTPDFPSRAPPRNEEASQVTWQMGDSPLKLSVPMELQVWPECSSTVSTMLWLEAEIAGLLTDARKRGERNLFGDATPAEKLSRVQDGWKKQCCSACPALGSSWVPRPGRRGRVSRKSFFGGDGFFAEVVSASGSGAGACPSAPLPEPAIFLVHRSTSQAGQRADARKCKHRLAAFEAVVVAKWPAVDFTCGSSFQQSGCRSCFESLRGSQRLRKSLTRRATSPDL